MIVIRRRTEMSRADYERVVSELSAIGVPLPESPEVLGRGSYGVVVATRDSRAVKATTDASEVTFARAVQQRPHPRLVRVDAARLLPPAGGRRSMAGAIVVERLEPLSPAEAARWWRPRDIFRLDPRRPVDPWISEALEGIAEALAERGVRRFGQASKWNVMRRPADGLVVLADLGGAAT